MTDDHVARGLPFSPVDADPRRPIDFRWMAAAVGTLLLVYLAMLNPYWVPSGDGEVYTCIARSLARGQGLMFNGSKAGIEPPGWPIVLSLAMRILPEFWFLKLIQILCMTGSMALAFLMVRRFVSDRMSAGVILLTGTLSVLYPLTFWMHTEAFFCLLGFAAMLIAFRIRDGMARGWEVVLLLFLLAYAAFTRWSGVLYVVVLVPILVSGLRPEEWPWRRVPRVMADPVGNRRRWSFRSGVSLALLLVGVVTFMGTHRYLRMTHEELVIAQNAGSAPDTESDSGSNASPDSTIVEPTTGPSTEPIAAPDAPPPGLDTLSGSHRGLPLEIAHRVLIAGQWFAWFLWQPTRFGQSVNLINIAGMLFGWLAIVLLVITMIERMFRHLDYFWIGLAAYTGGLCVIWPNPNARYFVPVAPFIVLGVFLGLRAIRDCAAATTAARWPAILSTTLGVAFVAATLLSNLPLLGIDIWVFRSRDFYAHYEAGSNQQLIEAAARINQAYRDQHLTGPIALSERYDNMGRSRFSPYGKRALHLLCDVTVYGTPKNKASRPTAEDTRKWARKYGCNFFVYQQPWYPWRVWHFRLPDALQDRLLKRKSTTRPIQPSGGWELWGRYNAGFKQVSLPPMDAALRAEAYPTRVPGL